MIYGVNNSIFSLRQLEYKIKQDIVFQKIIGLKEVPDYSTFSLRAIALEKHIYYGIYAMIIELINPSTRICAIDHYMIAKLGMEKKLVLENTKAISYIVSLVYVIIYYLMLTHLSFKFLKKFLIHI